MIACRDDFAEYELRYFGFARLDFNFFACIFEWVDFDGAFLCFDGIVFDATVRIKGFALGSFRFFV